MLLIILYTFFLDNATEILERIRFMLNILYEDPAVIVVEKPSGLESQASRAFAPDMVSQIQNYLWGKQSAPSHPISTEISTNWGKLSTKTGQKPEKGRGNLAPPYVAVIHRLDKPVSGVMVYAKTKQAAKALSCQLREGRMDKVYYAVVCGKPVDNVGNFVDYLGRDRKSNCARIVDKADKEGKLAKLEYQVLETTVRDFTYSLVRIHLLTGRYHQIRIQFASRALPLWGDNRYHPDFAARRLQGSIALCAAQLSFYHPITEQRIVCSIEPGGGAFDWFPRSAYEQ